MLVRYNTGKTINEAYTIVVKYVKVIALTVTAIIIIMIVGLAIPLCIPDNTGHFTAVGQSEAVGRQMDSQLMQHGLLQKNLIPKYQVVSADYTPTNKCTSPEDLRAYTVTIRAFGFMGVPLGSTTTNPTQFDSCQ